MEKYLILTIWTKWWDILQIEQTNKGTMDESSWSQKIKRDMELPSRFNNFEVRLKLRSEMESNCKGVKTWKNRTYDQK